MLRLRAVAPALSLVLAACGAAPATPTGHAAPSNLPVATVISTGDPDGPGPLESTPDLPSLPPDLAGFPVPPDAIQLPLPEGSVLLAWWAIEPGSGAYRFYREALPAAGYSITGLAPGGSVASIRFENPVGGAWQIDIHGALESAVLELGPEHP